MPIFCKPSECAVGQSSWGIALAPSKQLRVCSTMWQPEWKGQKVPAWMTGTPSWQLPVPSAAASGASGASAVCGCSTWSMSICSSWLSASAWLRSLEWMSSGFPCRSLQQSCWHLMNSRILLLSVICQKVTNLAQICHQEGTRLNRRRGTRATSQSKINQAVLSYSLWFQKLVSAAFLGPAVRFLKLCSWLNSAETFYPSKSTTWKPCKSKY